jgi:aldehyde dehydrogenase (NAD+)
MLEFREHYIGGKWVSPQSDLGTLSSIDSSTEVIGCGPRGDRADVAAAAAAASEAFPSWMATSVEERAAMLEQVGQRFISRVNEFAELFSRETGILNRYARAYECVSAQVFGINAELARSYSWSEPLENSTLVREPIGVVAAITPWNYPLFIMNSKVAPALAAGCTVVLKPSEVTPLTGFLLAEIAHDVGLPPGVLNVVGGTGGEVGQPLVSDPFVDMVSFTGSTRAGRQITADAGQTIKRIALELGGKSPCVVLDDGDLESAVTTAMTFITENAGQGCGALSRLVVPRHRVGEAEEIAVAFCEAAIIGNPLEDKTTVAPLASAQHRDRVLGYIEGGLSEGLRLVAGGRERPAGLDRGYFVKPTVFTAADSTATVAQEEVFGPVETIIPHDGDEDALRIANGTMYGLCATVFGADEKRTDRFAARLRAAHVDINGYVINLATPWGGYKQSGVGRQNGKLGFEEFLEVKTLTRVL